ncbi:hypothetical protein C900_03211 [Fulvivirga imtechensis AK7]|uniref:Uncharacterized protein n=2 Tax=Fulvivirga TaxID=396811 RepID=L8JRV2_9BACT|nr:hypothetical protein C900_03211 [Fulvivirga imtechensis AK7]
MQTLAATRSNGDDIFAKGVLEKYDKERQEATFKYEVVNPHLAEQELVIDFKAFITDEKEQIKTLNMQTDPFPKGHFIVKK